jgi:RNA polymerase sigma factor (sigma-70 family)
MRKLARSPGTAASHRRQPEIEGQLVDELFRTCASDLHGYAISLVGDRSAAEDITALAFERLYRSRSRLDESRGTPRAWLFAIARNAALDELRRRRRWGYVPADEQARDESAVEAIEQVERRATVSGALTELSPREREIVLLKFHGQLSNSEIAKVLGVSESNAGTRLHRALTHLRERYLALNREEVA